MNTDRRRERRIFVASPADVAEERDQVNEVAERINRTNNRHILHVVRWETHAGPVLGGNGAQDEIESQLEDIAECDIFVLIMWHRAGTPTDDGRSGTVREFEIAYSAFEKHGGKPIIMVYFCTAPLQMNEIDPNQLSEVKCFRSRLEKKGLFWEYPDRSLFPSLFHEHLVKQLDRIERPDPARRKSKKATKPKLHSELLRQIREAHRRISPHVNRTPIVMSKRLSHEFGCDLLLKLENIQATGSFKIRGAMNAVMLHEKGSTTFVTASAGNHGLGLAYSAFRWKHKTKIFMPSKTPLTKTKAIERYTKAITLEGETFEQAKELALDYASRRKLPFIHPYNDPNVVAGQGTAGIEIVDELKDSPPDLVVIPTGGGGLIAGVATVLRNSWPDVRIVGVEPARIPSLTTALAHGSPKRVGGGHTLAEGIAVAEVGDFVFPLIEASVDEVWSVSEESMAKAIVRLIEESRIMAEGAGAAPLAAIMEKSVSDPAAIRDKRVLLFVSGGNLDITALSVLLQRGLFLQRRLSHFQFLVDDQPGSLARITSALYRNQINIVDLQHSRFSDQLRVGSTLVDVLAETRDASHVETLLNLLGNEGFNVKAVRD